MTTDGTAPYGLTDESGDLVRGNWPEAGEGLSDRTLVKSLQEGNEKAFEVLYYRYRIPIYNLAYRMVGNREEAQDMTQEAFIKILRGVKSFDIERNFFSWLYKVATNVCLDHIRKLKRQPLISNEEMSIEGDIEVGNFRDEGALDLADRHAVKEAVTEALSNLPEHYRLILILRELQGFRYAEIAEIMGVSVYSVQTTLFRARKMFKKEYLKLEAADGED